MGIKKNTFRQSGLRLPVLFLQGCIIGIGGILPGISGGVLCVVFGLYRPIIETLSNPVNNIKKYWVLLIPSAAGILTGFFALAGITNRLMIINSGAAICVFIGLIIGMLPDLWKEAGKEGRSSSSILSMIAGFIFFTVFFMYLKHSEAISVDLNLGWFLFCGIAWGLSIIIPGLSSSSILIFFGLYQPMLEGVSSLDPAVILPLGLGILVVLLTLSRGVSLLYKNHYSLISHLIIGIVVATTIPIIPTDYSGASDAFISLLCLLAGLTFTLIFNKYISKKAKKASKQA